MAATFGCARGVGFVECARATLRVTIRRRRARPALLWDGVGRASPALQDERTCAFHGRAGLGPPAVFGDFDGAGARDSRVSADRLRLENRAGG